MINVGENEEDFHMVFTIIVPSDAGAEYSKSIADMGSRHTQNRKILDELLYDNSNGLVFC